MNEDAPSIELSLLQQLVGPEGAEKLFRMYLRSDKKDWRSIEAAVQARNIVELRHAAHSAKGLYATLQIEDLRQQCAELEGTTEPVDWELARKRVELMLSSVETLRSRLSNMLSAEE